MRLSDMINFEGLFDSLHKYRGDDIDSEMTQRFIAIGIICIASDLAAIRAALENIKEILEEQHGNN